MLQDTIPMPGVRVTLHRVGRVEQGPVDSTVTDARGRFDFRFVPDTTAVYLLSARYAGIQYFSDPVHTNPEKPDTGLSLAVSDTSASQPLEVEARHLVVNRPGPDGSRRVVDLVVLRNPGPRTRVAGDSSAPSWSVPLPHEAIAFEVGEGELAAAVERRGDSAVFVSPIPPGERQVVMQYALPGDASRVSVPMPGPADMINVLLEEPAARVEGGGVHAADTTTIEGKTFRRWTGKLAAPAALRLVLPSPARAPAWTLGALVAAMATALALAAWLVLRRQPAEVAAAAIPADAPRGAAGGAPSSFPVGAGALLDAIAELDARFLGREGEVGADDWARYRAERARLKAALQGALAGGPGVP
jgi:hypothetical protein